MNQVNQTKQKRSTQRLASVTFTYVGTDQQFDEFLKMLIHDYLSVDHPYQTQKADENC